MTIIHINEHMTGSLHYGDVIMGTMASQITRLTIFYSTVYSGADQRKHQSSASLAFVLGTGEFPAQMASDAKNVSIWLRHHVYCWDHTMFSVNLVCFSI